MPDAEIARRFRRGRRSIEQIQSLASLDGRHDGQEALQRFESEQFDLVVLDIMLPQMDGLEVCRRLRASSSVPIIMLTAKAEEIDKVLGPRARGGRLHHQAVLDARVPQPRASGAAPRRDGAAARTPTRSRSSAATCGSTSPSARPSVRGEPVELTFVEFEILAALARHPGPRLHARHAARPGLGRLGVPRPAHDRRPHQAPAREDRARPEEPRVPADGARRRLPLPGRMIQVAPHLAHLDQVQADAPVLLDHRGRDPGHLLLRRAAARVEPDLPEGRRAEARRRRLLAAAPGGDRARGDGRRAGRAHHARSASRPAPRVTLLGIPATSTEPRQPRRRARRPT